MSVMITPNKDWKTNRLLGEILSLARTGIRVQFLVKAGSADAVVQRLRVALSRSRKRNLEAGRKIEEFTLCNDTYPYTQDGIRYTCIVMWIEKRQHHINREILDDLMERN